MVKLYCCSDSLTVADAEDEIHRTNFSLVQTTKHKDDSGKKYKGSPSQANQLVHSFWVSKEGNVEGITSLNSFPTSLSVRIILTAKMISKLQNNSQHWDCLDLPHSLSPRTELSPRRGLGYFHILECWSRGEEKEEVTNPHLYLKSNDLEVI